jgi:hypothetical protein
MATAMAESILQTMCSGEIVKQVAPGPARKFPNQIS